jgi:hypothetical protein
MEEELLMSLDIWLTAKIETDVVDRNITHNLNKMWKAAGIYDSLYNSEGQTAASVLSNLEDGLELMIKDPERFKKLDSPNGWGTYENAVPWLTRLIKGFKEYPDGIIGISK